VAQPGPRLHPCGEAKPPPQMPYRRKFVSIGHCGPRPRWCAGGGIRGVINKFGGSRTFMLRSSWHLQGWLWESLSMTPMAYFSVTCMRHGAPHARSPNLCPNRARAKEWQEYRLFLASHLLMVVFLNKRYRKMPFCSFSSILWIGVLRRTQAKRGEHKRRERTKLTQPTN